MRSWNARAMRINLEAFAKAVEQRTGKRTPLLVPGPLVSVPLSAQAGAFLTSHHVPHPLHEFLQRHSYAQAMTLGNLVFDVVNEMPEENLDEANVRCIR